MGRGGIDQFLQHRPGVLHRLHICLILGSTESAVARCNEILSTTQHEGEE